MIYLSVILKTLDELVDKINRGACSRVHLKLFSSLPWWKQLFILNWDIFFFPYFLISEELSIGSMIFKPYLIIGSTCMLPILSWLSSICRTLLTHNYLYFSAAAGTNKAASSSTSLNTRKLDDETENLAREYFLRSFSHHHLSLTSSIWVGLVGFTILLK